MDWRSLLGVVAGGLFGTGLRLGIDLALPHADDEFPVATLLINTVGAFVLAVLVARLWATAQQWTKALLGSGLLGSFTTYSAFAVSIASLVASEEWPLALAYLVATMVLGLGAALLGLRAGRRAADGAES
jgi:CrcB protein